MPYENTAEIKNDVLFRGSEGQTASGWDAKVIDYINRVYRTLCAGASEFLPEYVEDWWWLRSDDVLTLLPVTTAGAVAVTQDDVNVTFSVPPVPSVVGYRLRVENHPEIFKVDTHIAGAMAATLDAPYTGPTGAASAYRLMKVEYPLAANVASIISPMIGYRQNPKIIGLSPERMDVLFPLPELTTGIPRAFALENEQLVRFSHGGRTDGVSMRIDYRFRPTVADLTDDVLSIPLVPLQWRHLLADMALTYLLLDKNDDRSNAVALAARTGLAGMLKENRRRIPKMDSDAGHIFPRGDIGHSRRGPLRTESGLIIG
jgi:hypothetical protein